MSQSKIIIVVGLPGSGKTYYAKSLNIPMFDDISDLTVLPETSESFVVVDVNCMRASIACKAESILGGMYPNHEIEWVYFENDPVKALCNVEYRDDGRRVSNAIKMFSTIYNPPSSALTIWQKPS